jgi:hypothetical protein
VLYFFSGPSRAILTHGFVKKGGPVPTKEIDHAVSCKERYTADPEKHMYKEPADDEGEDERRG